MRIDGQYAAVNWPVPHRNASQSLKPWLKTKPGSVARSGRTWPAPWRKITNGFVFGPSSTSPAEVMKADLIIIGDQSGCSSLNSAAMPAMCGLDIDVPLYRSNSRPLFPGGATPASTSCPGAMMSGFNRSPAPAINGPRDENDAVNGAGALVTIVACAIEPVA